MNPVYKGPTYSSAEKAKLDNAYNISITNTASISALSANIPSTSAKISATHGLEIGPSNTATFYLVDSATVWDDLVMPLQSGRTGGVAPTFAQWGTGRIFVFKFDNNDELQFAFQLPHTWKVGTMIYPHLHWCQDNGTASPGAGLSAVRWNIEMTWAGIPGGSFSPNATQTFFAIENVSGPNVQNLTNIPTSGIDPNTFSPTASTISSVIMMRLYRGGTGDTYGATRVNALSFDIHYQVDSLGSENIVQKYI